MFFGEGKPRQMLQCFAWLCLMAITPVHSQTVQKVVQIAKPEIPTLVYYQTGKESAETNYGDQGEIRFNDWSNDVKMQNIPESFQYRIECNTPHEETDKLWIEDSQIAEQISPTTCKQLISKNKITIKTSYTKNERRDSREIDFIPIPASQTWRGTELKQDKTGTPSRRLSSCCRQVECPNICLLTPEPQKCHLEVYTIRTGEINDDSIQARIARATVVGVILDQAGVKLTKMGGAFMHMRFKIPCDYCLLTSCATNCSNGEYATRTSAYQVKVIIILIILAHTADSRAGRNAGDAGGVQALPPWNLEHLLYTALVQVGHPSGGRQVSGERHSHSTRRAR
jgi:hypothetical protein